MHLLVAINNNILEWRNATDPVAEKPRLPLPYAFGAAFLKRGHQLSAINVSDITPSGDIYPFSRVYPSRNLTGALDDVDLAVLWGGHGVSAVLRQGMLKPMRRKVLLSSYVWSLHKLSSAKTIKLGLATQIAGRFAKAIMVMTAEQAALARRTLRPQVPVIRFRCGIDTAYYRRRSSISDVPDTHLTQVETLLSKPYVIMPGDELRCNGDALDMVANSDLRLVRISQYADSTKQDWLRAEIQRRGLRDRFFIFERISYPFMRFLLQHAHAYAGLVDSTWQPAGWTVACEALSSGLPLIVYDGLVSRELKILGISSSNFSSIPMGNIAAFRDALQRFVNQPLTEDFQESNRKFSLEYLDFEKNADEFVAAVENIVA